MKHSTCIQYQASRISRRQRKGFNSEMPWMPMADGRGGANDSQGSHGELPSPSPSDTLSMRAVLFDANVGFGSKNAIWLPKSRKRGGESDRNHEQDSDCASVESQFAQRF